MKGGFRTNKEYAVVELSLERLPSERFMRTVVHGKMDLVGKVVK